MIRKDILKICKNPSVMFKNKRWIIGIINNKSIEQLQNLQSDEIVWIKPNIYGDFYADPFITDYFGGKKIIFFEKYRYDVQKGYIAYLPLEKTADNNYNDHIRTAIELPTHLSFPYLFEFDTELYMIPENYQSNSIPLYKADKSPNKWIFVKELIPNFAGIDTVVFKYNSKWWLFSTLHSENQNTEMSDLYIWYSECPLDNWKAHPLNPIHYSENTARNAGNPLLINDCLYRLRQDCRTSYGEATFLSHITKLSETEFSETIVKRICGFKKYQSSLHTINNIKGTMVIDNSERYYSIKKFLENIKTRTRREKLA